MEATKGVSTPIDRRAELLAKKAEREAARALEREAHELELLELEDRLESELGPIGRAFDLVDLSDLGEGMIAVSCKVPGIQARHKAFASSKITDVDVDAFITPCIVHPSIEEFRAILARRPIAGGRVATTLLNLLGSKKTEDAKK